MLDYWHNSKTYRSTGQLFPSSIYEDSSVLYHGTSGQYSELIETEGIRWEDDVYTRIDLVAVLRVFMAHRYGYPLSLFAQPNSILSKFQLRARSDVIRPHPDRLSLRSHLLDDYRQVPRAGKHHTASARRLHPEHQVFPYQLRGLKVAYPNHVRGVDITYIRLQRGWMYLVAILDWYSRYVVSWEPDA